MRSFPFFLLLLAALAGAAEGDETAAIDIVRNPNAYSNRFLTARGTMRNLRQETTAGIPVPTGMIFDLVAGVPTASIRQQLYTNLIEATLVTCR